MSTVARLCLAAFLMDVALYLTMTGVPYKALALGAGPVLLGLLPAARALPYSLSTVWAGHRSRTGDRLRLARRFLAPAIAATAALALSGLPGIYLLLGLLGVAVAFFWPALQATLADLADARGAAGNLGWFNVAWSSGKACGFLLGGMVLAGFGFEVLFVAAAVVMGAVLAILVTLRPRQRGAGAPALELPNEPDHPRLGRFRWAGWIGNAVAFGIGAILNHHYPNWLEAQGRGEALFGTYLGLIFFAQTATFLLLRRFQGWRFRALPLIVLQAPLPALLLLLPRLDSSAAILATAPLVGLGLGAAYHASLFYSVAGHVARGRNAGIHEAVLGLGSLALPLLGGWAAQAGGSLAAPYLVGAAAGGVALLAQAGLLLSGGGGSEQKSGIAGI